MADRDKKQSFNLASKLTSEQRHIIEIRLIRDETERRRLEAMNAEKQKKLAEMNARHEEERRKTVEERTRKEVRPAPELKPSTAPGRSSIDRQIEMIRQDVDARMKPRQAEAHAQMRQELDRDLDRQIAAAKDAQSQGQSLNTKLKR